LPSRPRLLLLAPTLVLTALIIWAVGAGGFSAAGAWLTREPWGIVTLTDLYFGFILSALVIGATERRWLPALFWIVPIFVLGNVWTGLWFVLRWPELVRRLAPERTANDA
tara:strand:+ start:2634 stop:2963 length:330 start_codon:yes stop_codon:yes gene_type:complete